MNPFGDLLPGVNVGAGFKQLFGGGDEDVFRGYSVQGGQRNPAPATSTVGSFPQLVGPTATNAVTGRAVRPGPTQGPTGVLGNTTTKTGGSGSYTGGGSGGGAGYDTAAAADEAAWWQDQLGNLDQQLGRIGAQRGAGNQNIDNSYQSAFQKLTNDKNLAKRDFDSKRDQTVQDNIVTRNQIDSGVRGRLTGIQRLLGASGAGNSSAARVLAPYAAAKTGSDQRSQVDRTYSRNLGALDTGWQDTDREFGDAFSDLNIQRDTQRNQLNSGLAQTEAQLLEQKQNAEIQRRQAGGESYTQARAARQPYQSRISELIGTIDRLSINPNIAARAVNVARPDLSQYTYDRYSAPTMGPSNGAQSNAGAFWRLLQPMEREERRNQVAVQ